MYFASTYILRHTNFGNFRHPSLVAFCHKFKTTPYPLACDIIFEFQYDSSCFRNNVFVIFSIEHRKMSLHHLSYKIVNETVKANKMSSKQDCQTIFRCGAKFVLTKCQICSFEAKCAKSRVVQKMSLHSK